MSKIIESVKLSAILLALMLSVNSCASTEQKYNNCPFWLKPVPEDEEPYEEILSPIMIDFLYEYQQEYDINCNK